MANIKVSYDSLANVQRSLEEDIGNDQLTQIKADLTTAKSAVVCVARYLIALRRLFRSLDKEIDVLRTVKRPVLGIPVVLAVVTDAVKAREKRRVGIVFPASDTNERRAFVE